MGKDGKQTEGVAEPKKAQPGMLGILVLGLAATSASFGATYLLSPTEPITIADSCEKIGTGEVHIPPVAKSNQTYIPLQEVLITIGSEPASRYLKMNLAVVANEGGASAVESAEPVLIDTFNSYLRSIELNDFEDPEFYSHMREQLSHRSELVLGSAVSDGILITEFLLR